MIRYAESVCTKVADGASHSEPLFPDAPQHSIISQTLMLISLARSWATTLTRNPRRFTAAAVMARDYNVRPSMPVEQLCLTISRPPLRR